MKRRDFLWTGAGTALTVTAPTIRLPRGRQADRVVIAHHGDPTSITLRDPRARALALSAIDTARDAGAHYADVRLTNTLTRLISSDDPHRPRGSGQTVDLGLSVRVLVDGYWGWAATPILSTDEAVRVARLAVQFATQTASRSHARTVELSPTPVIPNGEWMTPVKIDPFELDPLEIHDWVYGTQRHLDDLAFARQAPRSIAWDTSGEVRSHCAVGFEKQERVFASTDGSFLMQTIITTQPGFQIVYRGNILEIPHFNDLIQLGWERIVDTPLIDLFRQEMDRADVMGTQTLPTRPLELGRYDVVFGTDAMAQLLKATFGRATELDRALGYWANTDGTSYLGPDPLLKLGTAVASSLVTITAERSNPLGVATAKWDDEGVAPEDFTLVKSGVLVDYQTTREQAPWLVPWYQKQGTPVRSHGCAMAPSALSEPLQHTPNLVLHPGHESVTEASLIHELKHGVYVPYIFSLEMDWQCSSGVAIVGAATEIKRGQPVSSIGFRAIMFDAAELWKKVQVLGGASSTVYGQTKYSPSGSLKGEPRQYTPYSVGSVPALVTQLAIVDPWQKA